MERRRFSSAVPGSGDEIPHGRFKIQKQTSRMRFVHKTQYYNNDIIIINNITYYSFGK